MNEAFGNNNALNQYYVVRECSMIISSVTPAKSMTVLATY